MARIWRWAAALAALAAVGGLLLLRNPPGQAQPGENQEQAAERVERRKDPVDEEREKLQLAVIGVDGQLVAAERTEDEWSLGVEFRDLDPKLDVLLEKALRLFTELDRTKLALHEVTIIFRSDRLKDVYGRALHDVVVGRLRLSGEQFRRIDWHGFEPHNFANVADEWWLHPEVSASKSDGLGGQQSDQGGEAGDSGGSGGGGGSDGSNGSEQ